MQSGYLVGEDLIKFKKGEKPKCWCRDYFGDDEYEWCTWEEDHYPMDRFMQYFLTVAYQYFQQLMPIGFVRDSSEIPFFVDTYGNDIRMIFCFD